jgi:hypothetical protein
MLTKAGSKFRGSRPNAVGQAFFDN